MDKLRDPKFLADVQQSMKNTLSNTQETIKAAAEALDKDHEKTRRRTGIDYIAEKNDVLRATVYEQSYPANAVMMRHHQAGHVSYRIGDLKTADCPLNYLHQRVEKKNRISDIQYAAGVRYREDVLSLARVGSNTAATIEHIIMAPELTSEDRWKKLSGVQFMSVSDDTRIISDPSSRILASVYRVRRIEDRLDVWELEILRDLIVRERPVGQIAARWGIQPEAASVMSRIALWKLARIMESSDREFQAWLEIERQQSGEGRQ